MSIKTLRKRIALVAVSALGAGLISIVSAPLANAAAGDIDVNIGRNSTSTGVCAIYDSGAADYMLISGTSSTGKASTLAAPLTVTVAVGGTLDINIASEFFTYSSGGLVADDTGNEVLHSTYGVWAQRDSSADTVTLTATAPGTVTVKSFATAPFASVDTPNTVYSTPNGTLTITVVASCSATGYSATYSAFQVGDAVDSTPQLTYGDTLTFSAGTDGYISIIGKNGYNQFLPGTTTWIASATNNAKVLIGTTNAIEATTTAAGTLSVVSSAAAGNNVYVRVTPADPAAGGTTTVTVTADGTTVLSKTLTFLPEATKIVIAKNLVGSLVGGEGAFLYQLQAANGTVVPGAVAVRPLTLDSRVTSVTAIKGGTIFPAVPGSTINGTATATVLSLPTTSLGVSKFACNTGSTTGSTKVTLRHTTPVNGAYVEADVTLNCAGGLATYTISTDKASYKIGEVATITVTGKDSTGAAVSDFTTIPTADALSVGGGTLIKNTALTDAFSGGVKNYQAQMTTAGTFNVASIISGSTTKTATASYTVTGADVSNTEVLAAIVKLIASINKQIKALQKSIKR